MTSSKALERSRKRHAVAVPWPRMDLCSEDRMVVRSLTGAVFSEAEL